MIAVTKPTWIIGHSMDPFDIESFSVVENIVYQRHTRSQSGTPDHGRVVVALVNPTAACVESSMSKLQPRILIIEFQQAAGIVICINITDSTTRNPAIYGIRVFIIAVGLSDCNITMFLSDEGQVSSRSREFLHGQESQRFTTVMQ